jgi:hypothetical protein
VQRELLDLVDAQEGRQRSIEGGACALFLRALCCGCCACCNGTNDRYKFARSHNMQSKKSSGNLDMSLLSDQHQHGAGAAHSGAAGRLAVHNGSPTRDQMMSVDSDFGEVPSSRSLFPPPQQQQQPSSHYQHQTQQQQSQHSYYDEDSTSNASSAGDYVQMQDSPGGDQHPAQGSQHRRIITPERGGNKSVLPKLP